VSTRSPKLWIGLLGLVAACGDDAGPPDARPPDSAVANGTISLTWSIADGATALTCAEVGSSVVGITAREVDSPFAQTDALSCSDGAGSTSVAPGTYDVTVSLGGVDVPDVAFDNVVVTTGQDTPAGDAHFEVQAVGGFAFRMFAGPSGNCTGAGVTAVSLALETLGGTCVPATFDIAAGASNPAGTYTTDCAAPAPFACIENDQDVTAQPTITTGSYRLHIDADVGGTTCWSRAPQFDVPANAQIKQLPLQNLTHDDVTPACNP
jgi:hypothetical protein